MPITVKSRSITPETVSQPTQPGAVQTGAPVIEALDIVGRTVSDLGQISGRIEAIDAKEKARVEKLRLEELDKNDKSVATEAVTLTKGAMATQINQYKNTRINANAKGLVVDYDVFSKELINKAMGNMTDQQKRFYADAMLPVNTVNRVGLIDWRNDQLTNGQRISANSSMDIGTQNAIVNFENPLTYAVERSNIEDQIDALADIEQWDADTKQLEFNKRIKVLETGRIERWSAKDASVAKELLSVNRDLFTPEEIEKFDKLLLKDDTLQFALAAVDNLEDTEPDLAKWDQAVRDMEYTGTDEEKAKKRARTQEMADARKLKLNNEKKAANKAILDAARNNIIREPDPSKRLQMAYALDSADHIEAALKTSRGVDAILKEEPTVTKDKVFLQLLDDIADGKYEKNSELYQFRPDLSKSDFNRAITELGKKLQSDKSGKKADDGVIDFATFKEAFKLGTGTAYDVEDDTINKEATFMYDELVKAGITDFGEAKDFIRNQAIDKADTSWYWVDGLSRQEAKATGTMDQWLPELFTFDDDFGVEKQEIDALLLSRGIVSDNETLRQIFKKNAILKEPLSVKETAEYERLIREAPVNPFKGGLLKR